MSYKSSDNVHVVLQGAEHTPDFLSTRIIFAMIFFGCVIIFQNFSASYTSFLAVITEKQPFTDLQTLYQDTDFTIGTPEGWATIEMFRVNI